MNLKLVIEADSATLINLLKLLPNAPMTAEVTAPVEPSLPFAAPAPAPAPAPSATTSGEPMFDETGLAWDERIHAPSKTMVADGSWRKRRNTDDATYAAVEAELRAKHPPAPVTPVGNDAPVPTVSGVVDAAPVTNEYVPTPPVAVATPIIPATPEPIVPVVAPVPVAPPEPVAADMDFPSLLQAVGTGISTGTLATDKVATTVQTLNATYGLAMQSLADLGDKPNLIQPAYNLLFGQ